MAKEVNITDFILSFKINSKITLKKILRPFFLKEMHF